MTQIRSIILLRDVNINQEQLLYDPELYHQVSATKSKLISNGMTKCKTVTCGKEPTNNIWLYRLEEGSGDGSEIFLEKKLTTQQGEHLIGTLRERGGENGQRRQGGGASLIN